MNKPSTTSLRKVAKAAKTATLALQARNAAIIEAHAAGESIRAIAVAANLSSARVHQIIHGR